MNEKKLIIEIEYGGLGDHLFHSHLPRIAKEFGGYDKVYFSNNSIFRHEDNKKLVWTLNPFLDGFVDESGMKCDLHEIIDKIDKSKGNTNILDEVMLAYHLDDGYRNHDPELYYHPIFEERYNKIIYDPNFLTYIGDIDALDADAYLKKNKIYTDAIMKIRSEKALYIHNPKDEFITTPTLFDFCNLIHSCKKLYCLTSGTATLAVALNKPATVFYGENQNKAFQHSKLHEYYKIEKCFKNKLSDFVKTPFRYLRKRMKITYNKM